MDESRKNGITWFNSQDIIAALNAQNVQVAAGSVGSPPQTNAQTFESGILVNGQLKNVSEFQQVIVKTIPSTGERVYLKDVARWNWVSSHFPAILLLMENGRQLL